jgi:hypothetical protein
MKRATTFIGLMCIAALAQAADTPGERQALFARLPNWTGIWIPDDGIMTRLGARNDVEGEPGLTFKDRVLSAHPPYKPRWESRFRTALRTYQHHLTRKECGFYFPEVMEVPPVFEILITPEQTTFIFSGREIRHIYTDGRGHLPADELWPTPWGDSVGRWEADTLVVDTIAVQARAIFSPLDPMLSTSARYTERIRKVDADHLEDKMTIVDQTALARPWVLKLSYTRVTSVDRLIHGDCTENDRNPVVEGKLAVAAP